MVKGANYFSLFVFHFCHENHLSTFTHSIERGGGGGGGGERVNLSLF